LWRKRYNFHRNCATYTALRWNDLFVVNLQSKTHQSKRLRDKGGLNAGPGNGRVAH